MKNLNQHGFTLVQAIFVLVVLGTLGAYMVTLSSVQQATSAQALQQARAYQAARAGLEWGIKYVTDNKACFSVVADELKIVAFDIDIDCDKIDEYREANQTYHVYNLKSRATYGGISNPDYVSRTLQVTIHDM